MARKRLRRKVPRVSLLDTSKVDALVRAIEQMGDLVATMKATLPGLLELVNVSRELVAITSRMHVAEQQQQQQEEDAHYKRSLAAAKANATRRARRAEIPAQIAGANPTIESNGEGVQP